MVEAARLLPTLMANESRLRRALEPVQTHFSYIIIDTPPSTGDLLVNGLVAATHILIPVEASYLGVSGLRELQRTVEEVSRHFSPDLSVLGYVPTLCDEQRSETQEILVELQRRYSGKVFAPIHKSADLAYAHSAHMDVFTYRPPRQRLTGQLSSSSRPTQEYGQLVEDVLARTGHTMSHGSNTKEVIDG
jgi:chromosome partitioning protein